MQLGKIGGVVTRQNPTGNLLLAALAGRHLATLGNTAQGEGEMAGRAMRVYFFNDTRSSSHAGCHAVCRSLDAALASVSGLTVIARHMTGDFFVDPAAFEEADAIFINGEGTIHHSAKGALLLLGVIETAKAAGKPVLLVNALFQQYEAPAPDILADLALLCVREPRSAAFTRRFGGDPLVLLDSAADPKFLQDGQAAPIRHRRMIGGAHRAGLIADPFDGIDGQRLAMRGGRFEDIVATLKQAEVYLTAQHHGVYAAALAGCPFVAVPSNSHKIEAFIDWTGLPIPLCMKRAEIEQAMRYAVANKSIFTELQDFMRSQAVLDGPRIAKALGLG